LRTEPLPFQEGLNQSINAVIGLYDDIRHCYPSVHCLLTSRLNQDIAESTFSQLRSLGGFYDHPVAAEFDHRVRLLAVSHLDNVVPTSNGSDAVGSLLADCSSGKLDGVTAVFPMCSKCDSLASSRKKRQVTSNGDAIASEHTLNVEALRYLAGYVAAKLRTQHPELGQRTALQVHTNASSWIQRLSKGGLVVPSEIFFDSVAELERSFVEFHGASGMHTCVNAISKYIAFAKASVNCVNVPAAAIELFSRTHLFIRMRHVAEVAQSERAKRRLRRKVHKLVT
jgi:hypothetical protein